MVRKDEARRAKEYLAERFDESGFQVEDSSSGLVLVRNFVSPVRYHLYFHTTSEGAKAFKSQIDRQVYERENVANIFYKDGENFFVPLCPDGFPRKSLKRYGVGELKASIRLSDKEKEVLRLQGLQRLVYYQPNNRDEGGRLDEGIASFRMVPLCSDYSHVDEERRGYDFIMAQSGTRYKERKRTIDKKVLDGQLVLIPSRENSSLFVLDSGDVAESQSKGGGRVEIESPAKMFLDETRTDSESWGGLEGIEHYINPQ